MAVQPDGKPIVGGSFALDEDPARAHVARFNTDGSRDASFSVQTDGFVQAIAIQADGSILLGGSFTTVNGTGRRNLVRLLAETPALTTFRSADNLVLCWPAGHPAPVLESASLGTRAWQRVTNAPVIVAGMHMVTNPTSGPGRIFRLVRPQVSALPERQ
jgi:hypothetical protein